LAHKKKNINLIPFIFLGLGVYYFDKDYILLILFVIFPLVYLILNATYKYIKKINKNKKYLSSGITIVDNLKGIEFEEFLLAHFKNLGYKGELTSITNDYGADLILKKDCKKIVVQAKRYSNKVGIEAVQQIIGAKEYYKADKGIVITNNYFTPNAVKLASSTNIELWDRNKLLNVFYKSNARETLIKTFGENIAENKICKKCNAEMKIKQGKYGEFYGCSNFPKCSYTEQIRRVKNENYRGISHKKN
jgi:restriction system protein